MFHVQDATEKEKKGDTERLLKQREKAEGPCSTRCKSYRGASKQGRPTEQLSGSPGRTQQVDWHQARTSHPYH